MKETMMQYFEWYLDPDGSLYQKLTREAAKLAKIGVTRVWLPPAFKGHTGKQDVGYGVYDLYDLGEFRQKGTVATKYGTKRQLIKTIQTLHKKRIQVVADVVLNHKMGADELEDTMAATVQDWNRKQTSQGLHPVRTWSKFTFPGRGGRYSDFIWSWRHFTGTDHDELARKKEILLFEGKRWNDRVSQENGNYDYIMGCDIDFTSQEVLEELYAWGRWFVQETQVDGFRLDALKNIDSSFFSSWLKDMHRYGNHPYFAVGEYWSGSHWDLKRYLEEVHYSMRLMDVPLHFHLQQASMSSGTYDIRSLFDQTLCQSDPAHACAFVDNHDTQPHQALESWVLDWFKPQAYASILLYTCELPCVFYGDYYGIAHDQIQPVPYLAHMIWIRSKLLSDNIVDLFDEDPQKACWMAYGEHPVIVLYTIGDWKEKRFCEPNYAGMTLVNATQPNHEVSFDETGWITITCPPGGLSVFISKSDYERMQRALKKETLFGRLMQSAVRTISHTGN